MGAPFDKVDYSPLVTYGYEQVVVSTVPVGLTALLIDPPGGGGPAKVATLRLETAQIRYTDDGLTVPSATVGTLLEIGETIVVWGSQNIKSFRAIRSGGADGKLNGHYGR